MGIVRTSDGLIGCHLDVMRQRKPVEPPGIGVSYNVGHVNHVTHVSSRYWEEVIEHM